MVCFVVLLLWQYVGVVDFVGFVDCGGIFGGFFGMFGVEYLCVQVVEMCVDVVWWCFGEDQDVECYEE